MQTSTLSEQHHKRTPLDPMNFSIAFPAHVMYEPDSSLNGVRTNLTGIQKPLYDITSEAMFVFFQLIGIILAPVFGIVVGVLKATMTYVLSPIGAIVMNFFMPALQREYEL